MRTFPRHLHRGPRVVGLIATVAAVALAVPAAAMAETTTSTTASAAPRVSRPSAHTSRTTQASRGRIQRTGPARPSNVLPDARGGGPPVLDSGDRGCTGADRASNGDCVAPDLAPNAPQTHGGATGTGTNGAGPDSSHVLPSPDGLQLER